jgi:gluconate 2-dehydrogenase gamma chain
MAAAPPAEEPAPGMKVLTARQMATLAAIAEQIIPADADPGARQSGAVNYIDGVLAGYQSDKFPLYAAGLQGTDETSQLIFGQNFLELEFDQQTSVLKSMEDGSAQGETWKAVSSQEFFATVWSHTLEGFYGPPRDGGNKNYVSWKMIGFPEHSGTM